MTSMIESDTVDNSITASDERARFEAFVRECEPRLRRAHVAALGPERGRDATAEAMAWAWEHWARVVRMEHPLGFLFRVGQSRTRGRRQPQLRPPEPTQPRPPDDPALRQALSRLSERQRVCVVLVHGFAYSAPEVGELLGIRPTSVQNHLERGLKRLRTLLEEQ